MDIAKYTIKDFLFLLEDGTSRINGTFTTENKILNIVAKRTSEKPPMIEIIIQEIGGFDGKKEDK